MISTAGVIPQEGWRGTFFQGRNLRGRDCESENLVRTGFEAYFYFDIDNTGASTLFDREAWEVTEQEDQDHEGRTKRPRVDQ